MVGVAGRIKAWKSAKNSTILTGFLDRSSEPYIYNKFQGNGFNSAHWFRWTTDLVLEYRWVCKIENFY